MMEYKKEAPEFIDAEMPWQTTKDDITFRYIVMRHIMKIALLASVEFRGGYWQEKTKLGKDGAMHTEKVYIPDTREEYGNAINVLHDLLIPHFDKKMEDKSEEINSKLIELRTKCINKTSIDEKEYLETEEDNTPILAASHYTGKDRAIIEAYRFRKVELIRELFQELSKFLKRKDYLGAEALIE